MSNQERIESWLEKAKGIIQGDHVYALEEDVTEAKHVLLGFEQSYYGAMPAEKCRKMIVVVGGSQLEVHDAHSAVEPLTRYGDGRFLSAVIGTQSPYLFYLDQPETDGPTSQIKAILDVLDRYDVTAEIMQFQCCKKHAQQVEQEVKR